VTARKIRYIEESYLNRIIEEALHEDLAFGDLTTEALIDPGSRSTAHLLAGEDAVLAGLDIFRRVFLSMDPKAEFEFGYRDGEYVSEGDKVLEFTAQTESILKGERTALNFVQYLSGVATRTRAFLKEIGQLPVTLLDTRKTTPGTRALVKYAVRVGGGKNHRFGLFDGIMIKDNHRAVLDDVGEAIVRLKDLHPTRKIEVECSTREEVKEAVEAGADIILLDNMSKEDVSWAVDWAGKRCIFEVSGRINLNNIKEMASTGIDYVSAGSIIHGAVFVDFSLEIAGHDPASP
jgi:nicotinate-nucleotide pyrophosphorylase (carboxylating)